MQWQKVGRRPRGSWSSTSAYRLIGLAGLGLALLGTVLPLLPTTPFLLLAAWAFGRSSPRLRTWLDRHPRFGPLLRDWDERRVVPARAKLLAAFGLSASWVLILLRADGWVVPALTGALLSAVGGYVLTRPSS